MNERPAILYRYESVNERSLQNLKAGVVFFSSVRAFNDGYDCNLPFRAKRMTANEVAKFRRNAHKIFSIPKIDGAELYDDLDDETIQSELEEEMKEADRVIAKQQGVACFSERHDSLLMWAHYARNASGYCLEFDSKFEPFNGADKVNYQEAVPEFDLARFMITSDGGEFRRLHCVKSIEWAYEREWRSFSGLPGMPFKYPPEALIAVYLGPRTSICNMRLIKNAAVQAGRSVQFFRGRFSESRFAIEFDRVN